MNIAPNLNYHNSNSSVSFNGLKTPNPDDIKMVQKLANQGMDGLWDKLIVSVENKTTGIVKEIDGVKYIPNDTVKQKITEGIKTFFGMPLDVIDTFAKKFPNSRLYNAKFLQRHRENVLLENQIHALQGIYENGAKYTKNAASAISKKPEHPINKESKEYYDLTRNFTTTQFNSSLNKKMRDKVADYDTKKERFAARLISGGTAAIFLGNDFYNKAIQKDKTEEEAKKEQHLKQWQEAKETIFEAVTQFAILACFSKSANSNKPWVPALLTTGIGLISRVISRKTSGMQITRIEVPQNRNTGIPTINEFVKSANENDAKGILDKKQEEAKNLNIKKKPVLSFKNILLFCAASITTGYTLRFAGRYISKLLNNKIKINGKSIAEKLEPYIKSFNNKITEQIQPRKEKLEKMSTILSSSGEEKLAHKIDNVIKNHTKPDGTIYLGKVNKRINLRGNRTEVRKKDLYSLALAPFRFIKEITLYPYKIATKLEHAITGKEPRKPDKKTEDMYNIISIYKRFLEFEQLSKGDDEKLKELFGNYAKRMRLASNNNITAGKGDNSKIAVIATTLGTLTGMWFNMNDEFNSSIRNGSTKEEAEKDARLRGINKFIRMSVQTIILGSLNNIFRKQYNSSIAKAGIVVAMSTFLTDTTSRILSGMPMGKKTKEELEEYQNKKKQEGLSAKYYNMIDKLAS